MTVVCGIIVHVWKEMPILKIEKQYVQEEYITFC